MKIYGARRTLGEVAVKILMFVLAGFAVGFASGWWYEPIFLRTVGCALGVEVVDADTIKCRGLKRKTRLRIAGVDAPDTRKGVAACYHEEGLGEVATRFVKDLVKDKRLTIQIASRQADKFGRTLISASVNDRDLYSLLSEEKLAIPYEKENPDRMVWCRKICNDPFLRDQAREAYVDKEMERVAKKDQARKQEELRNELNSECARFVDGNHKSF